MSLSTLLPHPSYLNSAAALVAMALISMLSKIKILSIEVDETNFLCRFSSVYPLDAQLLELITEKCRQWVMQNLAIEMRKMLSCNAADYFNHLSRDFESSLLLERPTEVIDIVKIGDFPLAVCGPHLESTKELAHIQLLDFSLRGSVYEIIGTAHQSKEELKSLLRFLKKWNVDRCEAAALRLSIFDASKKCWLSQGVLLKNRLKLKISEAIDEEKIALFEGLPLDERLIEGARWIFKEENSANFKEKSLINSLIKESCHLVFPLDLANPEKTAKRSLHLIKKTSKILGLGLNWLGSSPALGKSTSNEACRRFEKELLSLLSLKESKQEGSQRQKRHFRLLAEAFDGLQKAWPVIELTLDAAMRVKIQLPVSLERIIALNLECGAEHFNQWTKEIVLSDLNSDRDKLEEK